MTDSVTAASHSKDRDQSLSFVCVLLLCLITSACSTNVSPAEFRRAEYLCENRQGLRYAWFSREDGHCFSDAVCNDGARVVKTCA